MEDDFIEENQLNSNRKDKIRFYYSFSTVILLFCIVYISYSALLNIPRCINMPAKKQKMIELNKAAIEKNKMLKKEINDFESLHSLEAIARNNLKMAGEDEILVIVNKKAVNSLNVEN